MKKEENKMENIDEHSITVTPQQPVSSPLVSKCKQRKKSVKVVGILNCAEMSLDQADINRFTDLPL